MKLFLGWRHQKSEPRRR
jgi:hypothetical protein